jgi:hypothetical protein
MSKILKSVVVGLMFVGMNGCVSTNDINVVKLKVKNENLKEYKTYMSLTPKDMIIDSQGKWVPKNIDAHTEIQHLIKAEMDKKGKHLVKSNPDFYVTYALGVDLDSIKEKINKKDQVKIVNVPSAGLAIVFTDAKTHKIIWMSVAESKLKDDSSLENRKKRAKHAIKQMLSGL